MNNQPIVRRKLADEVRDRLLAVIQSGELHPGDQLPSERDLMTRYAVGRPAIREALQSLASDGIIEISHGERAKVAVPDVRTMFDRIGQTMVQLLRNSPGTLDDLKQARVLFEVGMVRMAARNAAPADIVRLTAILDQQRDLIRDSKLTDVPAFVKADMAFHSAIASMSGNSVCALLSAAMLDWLFHFQRDLLRIPGSEGITLAEHQRLLAAVACHDSDEAERAMLDHLTRANQRYRVFEAALANSSHSETK